MLSHLNQDKKNWIFHNRRGRMLLYDGYLFLLFFSQLPKVHDGESSYPPHLSRNSTWAKNRDHGGASSGDL